MLVPQASEAGWNPAQFNAGGQAPNRLSYGWSARFDTETCNFRRWKLLERSVGVLAAHVRGKDEDRVQFPDGPLEEHKWAVRPMGGRLVCNQEIGVRISDGPLCDTGSWSNGKTPPWHGENLGSIPSESTDTEGSRIRLAGPHC